MRQIDYNALLVDITDSIGIVTDADTYELLYMNKAALRAYNIPDGREYHGKYCYEVLQGLSQPCENCPIKRIPAGDVYRWEQFNRRSGRWHDNTDHIVERDGRSLYVKIARDITARKEGTLSPSDNLTMEDTLFHCLHILAREKDFSVALQLFLEALARYYRANRAYIFEFEPEKQTLSNTYEWCREGVTAEIENLQDLPLEVVREWIRMFESEGEFSINAVDTELDPDSDEYRILAAQGISSLMAAPIRKEDGTIAGFLGVDDPERQVGNLQMLRSATEFIRAEFVKRQLLSELEFLCYADVLTGTYNRKQYEHYIKKYALKEPESLGVVVVNINGMKDINANYGAEYGDEVICCACKIMRERLPGQIFRINGDEFVALCEDVRRDHFQAVVSELRLSFRNQQDCSVSIGCAWQTGEIVPDKIVSQAEELMHAEKRNYYDSVLKGGGQSSRKSAAEEVLREIEDGRFVAYFQPQIDFASGRIFGAEALVRKLGEDGNLIPPNNFIPFYEAAGMIRYLDLHMLELACAALQKWEAEGIDLRVSVNFSRLTLMEPEIVDAIVAVCDKYCVSLQRVTVEVTESISKMEASHLRRLIGQLKEKQFHISLDDFGSSYSNLAILSTIEFDEVKFDRTLISDIETNSKSQVVVRNGMKMCEELDGSLSVAEGIETKEQMELLIGYGCCIGQGYYFSRPISQAAFSALLKEGNACCAPQI